MNFYQYLLIILIATTFFACEKVIEVDIKNATEKYFIEAYVFDEPGNNLVFIKKTQSVFDDEISSGLDNAAVNIEADGMNYALDYQSDGYYNNNILTGKSGTTYKLTINVNGETFTSNSVMPNKTEYDSLIVTLPPLVSDTSSITFCEEGIYFIFNQYTDIANEKNFYLFDYNRDIGSEDTQIYIQDDIVSDGVTTAIPFFNQCFEPGQQVDCMLFSLTETMYKYYFVLQSVAQNGSPGGDVTPQNPDSNIEGGALGFFSTATISRKSVTVE